MKTGLFFSIALIFSLIACNNATSNQATSMLYVINYEGAKIYDQPNFNAKSTSILANGSAISIKDTINADSLIIDLVIVLKGYWLELNDQKGYVFSSDLTKIQPQIKAGIIPTISLLGAIIDAKTIKEVKKIGSIISFETENKITTYENAIYQHISSDGCWDHIYTYKHLSFNEVYHQMMNRYSGFYGSGDDLTIEKPKLIRYENEAYFYKGLEATPELMLKINDAGQFETFSYDCT